MSILQALLSGILQGITEFLPVSSEGHLAALSQSSDLDPNRALLFVTFLHFGSLLALILVFQKDLQQIFRESLAMLAEGIENVQLYFQKNKHKNPVSYRKIVRSSYRKLTVMVLTAMFPSVLLGIAAHRLVALAMGSPMMPGIGMLLTGVFLIVVDFSRIVGHKTARTAGYDSAMWVGICQGLSVFPGISRCGLTIGAGLFSGFSRKMAIKFSYLVSIPAILGAFLWELPEFWKTNLTSGEVGIFFFAMIISAMVSFLVIRVMMKIAGKVRLRYFALYSFLAGAVMLWIQYRA